VDAHFTVVRGAALAFSGHPRQHTRYALDVRARLFAEGNEITVRTLEISEGGVGLVSPVELAEGGVFLLKMELPGVQGVFEGDVQQRSRNGFRYGFQFVALCESNRVLLRKFARRWGIHAEEGYAGRDKRMAGGDREVQQ
jgi:hypothetical protein